jgi:hypothetical protein
MKNFAVALLVAAGLSLPAFATPALYIINLTYTGYAPLPDGLAPPPIFGSFVYDPDATALDGITPAGFLSFNVNWEGQVFDFASAANNLTLTADPPTGCGPATGGSQYAFLLMTQTAAGCDAKYAWSGLYYSTGFALFSFVLNPGGSSGSQDVINAAAVSFTPVTPALFSTAVGSWTVSPEPGTLCLILLGTLAVAVLKRGRPTTPVR